MLKQPRAVWAVAFACVIAFMGIGLVDPILPAISAELGATTAETELLFTSYLLVTGLAMFFTSFVSSRLGAKTTLLVGLALIVVFVELWAIVWIQNRFMETPFFRATFQVVLGGALVLAAGILIGGA